MLFGRNGIAWLLNPARTGVDCESNQKRKGGEVNALFEHSAWIYKNSKDNRFRYVLGESGDNPLICVGVNPSTATPEQLDPTLRNVKSWAKRLGYNGWAMFNLNPQRATNPNDMAVELAEPEFQCNASVFCRYLEDHYWVSIWAAWGTLIEKRPYLPKCLDRLASIVDLFDCRWIHIGPLTTKGHPHHPLYLSHKADVQEFDIQKYVTQFQTEAVKRNVIR